MDKNETDIEKSVKTSLDKRVTRLEYLVRRLLAGAEIHWGKDIDGDGKIGWSRYGTMLVIVMALVGSIAFAATRTVVDWTKGTPMSAATAKVEFDTTTSLATLTVDNTTIGTLIGAPSMSNSALEVNGDITLANDETIDNATDAKVRVTYNDDAATLGELILESDNLAPSMADNDLVSVIGKANDDMTNKTEFASFDLKFDDVTDATEDGSLVFKAFIAGTERTLCTMAAATTLGASQATLALTSSDWAIDSSGTITAASLSADQVSAGTISAAVIVSNVVDQFIGSNVTIGVGGILKAGGNNGWSTNFVVGTGTAQTSTWYFYSGVLTNITVTP